MSDHGDILVVDDTPDVLEVLTTALVLRGYRARGVSSGEQALAAVAEAAPELVLLDIRMPDMDGYEVCRRLKAGPATCDIPIVFLTGATEVQERVAGFALGAVDYVTKPFEPEELLARLRTHLELHRLRTQLETQVAEQTGDLRSANEQLRAELTKRQRAEEKLRVQAVLLSTQQETSLDGILIVDEDGAILSHNRRFADLWRIPEEVLATRSDELALRSVFDQLLDPQQFLEEVEYLYVHHQDTSQDEVSLKDGRTLERYSAPMFGPDATYYGRVWYFRDVSERKRADEALRKSEEKFSQAFQASPAIMAILSLTDGRCVEVNAAFERRAGWGRDEVVGQQHLMPSIWADHDDEDRLTEALLVDRCIDGQEIEFHTKTGESVLGLLSAQLIEVEGEPCALVVVEDITERRRVEEELRASEARFRSLYEGSHDAVLLFRDGLLVDCNHQALELFGYGSREELVGLGPADLSPANQPDGRDSRLAAGARMEEALQRGFARFEWTHQRRTGEGFPTDTLLSAFSIGEQRVLEASVRDISEVKQVEAEIRTLNAELEERVSRRTAELEQVNQALQARSAELEVFNRAMIGRETRVVELKEEINQLCEELGRPAVYPPVWTQSGA